MLKAFKHSLRGRRNDNDLYPTHHSMTWQLMEQLKIPEDYGIHDPACGNNDILIALQECGVKNQITGTDLIPQGDDFLISDDSHDVIFTNPPFTLASLFLEKAIEVARDAIIFLLPLDYLHGYNRYISFYKQQEKFYLSQVYIFVRRPMFTKSVRKDGRYNTGSVTFAWFVWTRIWDDMVGGSDNSVPEPIIKWIDNNKYVIGSTIKKVEKQGELF